MSRTLVYVTLRCPSCGRSARVLEGSSGVCTRHPKPVEMVEEKA